MGVVTLLAGAALGAAFGELKTVVLAEIKRIVHFKATLKRIEAIVLRIAPVFEDIESLKELDRPQQQIDMLTDELKKGTTLIRLCFKKTSWNWYSKRFYSKKLRSFEKRLTTFFQFDVQAIILREVLTQSRDSKSQRQFPTYFSWYSAASWAADLPDRTFGLGLALLEVKAMLLKGDTNSSSISPPDVVLLSAPPGCGKTTLAKMLCRDSDIIGRFKENIFCVTVSKTANIKVIVTTIFLHKYDKLPLEFQSDEDAINQLGQFLTKIGGGSDKDPIPILLTLDDVWSPVLESLIQKFSFRGIPGYKLLVTSRFDPPAIQTVYRLDLLNHEDATKLFRNLAFPPDLSLPHVSNDTVNEVVKACKGFPLALSVIALSLRGKEEASWKTTLYKWSKGQSTIFDSCSELLNILKTSLDALDDKILKDCFLDLGSFPDNQRIPATALWDMWADLYDVPDEEGMNTYNDILELSAKNLLNLVPIRKDDSCDLDGYCNGLYVTLYAMLRKLAIHQCSQQEIVLRERLIIEIVGKCLPEKMIENLKQPLHAHLLSISTDDSFTSSWWDMQLPEAEVLILNLRSRNYTLPQFIKAMDRLKVLIVTNYGFNLAKLDNFPVIGFTSHLKRIRLEHVSISSSFGSTAAAFKLTNLQKISLTMCEIGNALDNCGDMFPNLVEIEIEYCRDMVKMPTGLCDNIFLKKISITSCNELSTLPQEIGKLINLKSLRLNSCTNLGALPETVGCLQKLEFLDISECLRLSELPKQIGDLRGLRTLHMRGCSGLLELPSSVEELKNLTVLCDKQTAALWVFYPNVEVEEVENINLYWIHN